MGFKRTDLNRLQELKEKFSWEVDLKDKGLQKGWQLRKETVPKIQMQTTFTRRTTGTNHKTPARALPPPRNPKAFSFLMIIKE